MTEEAKPSVGTETQTEIWTHYYGAVFASEYYSKVGDRFLTYQKRVTVSMQILGAGSVVPVLLVAVTEQTTLAAVALSILGITLAVLSTVAMVGEFARKSAVAFSIARRCGEIATEWSNLWSDAYDGTITQDVARHRLTGLTKDLDDETHRTGDIGIQTDDDDNKSLRRLRDNASRTAVHLMETRHGTQGKPEAAAFA